MEKVEVNAMKNTFINIEHIEIGSLDLGLKGKQSFFWALPLGLIFYALSSVTTDQLSTWFTLFYALCFFGFISGLVKMLGLDKG